jgi:sortase A
VNARRALSVICTTLGIGIAAWAVVTWAWQDPFTALHQALDQRALAHQLSERRVAHGGTVVTEAGRFARASREGEAMGRIEIPRIALDEVLVDGTNSADLAKGPGIYVGDDLPGQSGLVYIAGHRTTHGAPFSHIDQLRVHDAITIAMPYGTFRYLVTGHRIVPANDLGVLKSRGQPQLILQTCWPRFSASHRYLVYARPM